MPTYMNDMGEFVDRDGERPHMKLRHAARPVDWDAPDDDGPTGRGKFVKVCDVCGNEFRTNVANALRCSAECRAEAERRRASRKAREKRGARKPPADAARADARDGADVDELRRRLREVVHENAVLSQELDRIRRESAFLGSETRGTTKD